MRCFHQRNVASGSRTGIRSISASFATPQKHHAASESHTDGPKRHKASLATQFLRTCRAIFTDKTVAASNQTKTQIDRERKKDRSWQGKAKAREKSLNFRFRMKKTPLLSLRNGLESSFLFSETIRRERETPWNKDSLSLLFSERENKIKAKKSVFCLFFFEE